MATRPASPRLPAALRPRLFTPASPATRTAAKAMPQFGSRRPQASASRRLADLAGRSVAISGDVPAIFDAPLAAHHKLIGRWAAKREQAGRTYTRVQARRHIELLFNAAVLEILDPIELADFRAAVLLSEENGPPAIVILCQSLGQLDLGWIETSEAPIPWRAAAYQTLEKTLRLTLPVFGYDDLFDEISIYYWDGETEDEAAREALIQYHGADAEALDELSMPSTMNAKRPEWMLADNAAPATELPAGLRKALHNLCHAHGALRTLEPEQSAWHFEWEQIQEYVPEMEECSRLPAMTLVPFDQFARELDDVGRHGMEMGFMDIAGICPLPDASRIDHWFASLHLGAQFLLAAQALIQLDPAKM
ncbi:hypothetical protein KRZ98_16865 [Sphingobium sp. AS12]|nr:hypothetical protein [Sphingobium sp. AS12]